MFDLLLNQSINISYCFLPLIDVLLVCNGLAFIVSYKLISLPSYVFVTMYVTSPNLHHAITMYRTKKLMISKHLYKLVGDIPKESQVTS